MGGKRTAAEADSSSGSSDDDEEPYSDEVGSDGDDASSVNDDATHMDEGDDDGNHLNALQQAMMACLRTINECTDDAGRSRCDLFQELPDRETYPDYYILIHNPICLTQIEEFIREGAYADMMSFAKDVDTMFDNAKVYNQEGSQIYVDAEEMQAAFENEFEEQISKLPLTGGIEEATRQVDTSMAVPPSTKPASKRKKTTASTSSTASKERTPRGKKKGGPSATPSTSAKRSTQRRRKAAAPADSASDSDEEDEEEGEDVEANFLEPSGMYTAVMDELRKNSTASTERLCRMLTDMDRYRMNPRGFLSKWGFPREPFKSMEHAQAVAALPNRPVRQNISVRAVSKSEYPDAAVKVLQQTDRTPLHYRDLTKRTVDSGLLDGTSTNVHVTMNSQLNRCLDFYNAGHGYFGLMEWRDEKNMVPGTPKSVQKRTGGAAKNSSEASASQADEDDEPEPIQLSEAEVDAFVVLEATAKAGMEVTQVATQMEARIRAFDIGLIEYRTEAAHYLADHYAERAEARRSGADADIAADDLVHTLVDQPEFSQHRDAILQVLKGKPVAEVVPPITRPRSKDDDDGDDGDGKDRARHGRGGGDGDDNGGDGGNDADKASAAGSATSSPRKGGEHGEQQQQQQAGGSWRKAGNDINMPFSAMLPSGTGPVVFEGHKLNPATVRGTQRKVKRWRGTQGWNEHWKTHDRPNMGSIHKTYHLGMGASSQGRCATGFPHLQVAMGSTDPRG